MHSVWLLACWLVATVALDNGLGRRPQMGYNSNYDLGCAMNETMIRETIDAMVAKGLPDLGYNYVNLDDCWAKGRHADGTVFPDPTDFPSGMQALADYAHSHGLKFGLYTDRGNATCGGRPGSQGHETIDAETYARWGVDYVKEDSCYASTDPQVAFAEYATLRDALNKTGRHMFFSLCGWHEWYAPVGHELANSWRIGPDDNDWDGVLLNADIDIELGKYAGFGGWNDPCLLMGSTASGARRLTSVQSRSQFGMWTMLAAPLLLSLDIRDLDEYDLKTYSNPEVIAVNQDSLGKQGFRINGGNLTTFSPNIWGRMLSSNSSALLFINPTNQTQTMSCDDKCFQAIGFPSAGEAQARDLWAREDLGPVPGVLQLAVPANDSALFRITKWI